ncbi:hypothetical protein LTR62_005865 [Meristemomyces frigidus]|uniref:Transcription initiation factor TFIID subunit 10 n=1 Tax=Meristemomyces frigidus TaxID=1508187 RepID=A0AAN7YS02_9PEZI|nr:hypothetical protein LTR62_005865 [Meristemomyces frigidus]
MVSSDTQPEILSDTTVTEAQPPTQPTQSTQASTDPSFDPPADHDLDAEINDTTMNGTTTDGSADLPLPPTADQAPVDTSLTISQPPPTTQLIPEPRIAQKKDATLREFLSKMDDYAPIIPDAVTDHYLTLAGLPPPPQTDRRLARLLALATQKFIADIAADAYQYSRIRSTNTTSNNPLTGLGGAAGFGTLGGEGDGKGAKKEGKGGAPIGGPRAGFGGGGAGAQQGRTVLTMEDLGMAVGEYGVNVRRGEFYR